MAIENPVHVSECGLPLNAIEWLVTHHRSKLAERQRVHEEFDDLLKEREQRTRLLGSLVARDERLREREQTLLRTPVLDENDCEDLVAELCERLSRTQQKQGKSPFSDSTRKLVRKVVNRWYRHCRNSEKNIFSVNRSIPIKRKLRRRFQIKAASTGHKLSADSSNLLDAVVICHILKHVIEEEEFYGRDRIKSARTDRR